ncbi:MAG TPA: aldehyde dehydrogenase family protein [Gaiellaceae bacterium]|nr:aldehyde dehydrogenase family protein [Gaiellaceae bacterium]
MSVVELTSYVAGEWRAGAETIEDRNPARPSEVVAEVRAADPALAEDAASAAAEAFAGWRDTPSPARGDVLRRAADLLERRAEEVGRDLAREEGKTFVEAVGETARAVAILRYYAGQTLEPDGETYPSHSASTFLYARREPLGPVAAITPWNFPIAIPAWKLAPALAYGNTVVWKPAELVPLTSVHLARALADAGLPPGVLNLVLGRSADVGETVVGHDAVAAITFTGSNEVGRRIQLTATARGKKVQLELGGKNPAIVLADADLEQAAEQVARGAFLSAGQKCTATSRVIVESSVLAEFAERLVDRARSWKVGDPLDPDTTVGPLASEAQLARVSHYLDVAKEEGATPLAGADGPAGDGYYVRPTVLGDVAPESPVAREEIFGPVAALLEASSYEDAVAQANDTPFGLTASLFTRDLGRALRFAREARAGVVKVNQETAGLELQAPFGGTKQSSSGSREQGKVARDFFTEWKTVYVDPPTGGAV